MSVLPVETLPTPGGVRLFSAEPLRGLHLSLIVILRNLLPSLPCTQGHIPGTALHPTLASTTESVPRELQLQHKELPLSSAVLY